MVVNSWNRKNLGLALDAAVLVRLQDALQAESDANRRVASLIRQAREEGATWFNICFASGLSIGQLQTRVDVRPPSRVRRITHADVAPLEETIARREPFPSELNVTEAAESLGVSRSTVHRMARAGHLSARLRTTERMTSVRLEAGPDRRPVRIEGAGK